MRANPSHHLAAAYIRYSSNMQDNNFTLDAQLLQIKTRAQADGVVIVKVYSDPGASAYTKRYKPGNVEMLQGAHKKEFHYLYVHKVDRLEWAIDIAKQIENDGVILKAVEQNFDLGTPKTSLRSIYLDRLGSFTQITSARTPRKADMNALNRDTTMA
jgi:DNA invertase Pin-like site-specific DNA recombinase